jgi:hypothetical protein
LRALAIAQAAGEVPVDEHGKREAVLFGANAIVNLLQGRDTAAANATLRRTAAWFDADVAATEGRNPRGEVDFAAFKLCQAWHLFPAPPAAPATGAPDPLEPATREAIRRFFLTHDFASLYQSENHVLMLHAARHLMGQAWPDATFAAYGKTGAQLATGDAAWLREFLRQRARFGWGEFDSVGYLVIVWEILLGLRRHTRDTMLRRLAGMTLDVLLAGMAAHSRDGMYCGAHARIYPNHALDHAEESVRSLHYLYFAPPPPLSPCLPPCLPLYLLIPFASGGGGDDWRPIPAVVEIACRQDEACEIRERKHLHNTADALPVEPLHGSIRKYTFRSPRCILGCIQYQDTYPSNATCPCHNHYELPVPADQRDTAGYAQHQQHNWDLTFTAPATRRTDARIFTHHPGDDPTHNYWTGDRLCGCGHFFQNKNALVALYDIAPAQPNHFIHAHLPRAAFDEVVIDDDPVNNGWIFVRAGDAFAGLRFSSAWRWTTTGEWAHREIVSDGLRHAIVCETGDTATSPDFAAFRQKLHATRITFDREAMTLEYHSAQAGILFLDTHGTRHLDGSPVNLDYPGHASPYMYSAWGSGVFGFPAAPPSAPPAAPPATLDFTSR